jgi:hypothetical protein
MFLASIGRSPKLPGGCFYAEFRCCVEWVRNRPNPIPLVILPGRGYGTSSCRVARESMARLDDEFGIWSKK